MNTNTDQTQRSAVERKTKALFDDSVAHTDAATQSRLNRARQRAMAELDTGRRWSGTWLPAGVAAAAAAVLVTIMLGRMPDGGPDLESSVATDTDLQMLLTTDDLELIEELEFYAWLDEQPELEDQTKEDNGVG